MDRAEKSGRLLGPADPALGVWFKSHDPRGNASIWTVPVAGGNHPPGGPFDDPARPSYRNEWALGRGRIYFTVDDRQGDIWVIEAKRP